MLSMLFAEVIVDADPNPLAGLVQTILTSGFFTAVGAGVLAIWLRRTRSPADKLAEAQAAAEKAKQEALAEAAMQAAKDEGYRMSVQMIKEAAEAQAESFKLQLEELRKTIATLSAALTAAGDSNASLQSQIAIMRVREQDLEQKLKDKEEEIELMNLTGNISSNDSKEA